jgi:hypothetical protein
MRFRTKNKEWNWEDVIKEKGVRGSECVLKNL